MADVKTRSVDNNLGSIDSFSTAAGAVFRAFDIVDFNSSVPVQKLEKQTGMVNELIVCLYSLVDGAMTLKSLDAAGDSYEVGLVNNSAVSVVMKRDEDAFKHL